MTAPYLLGVDIGTYSSKGTLARTTGEVIATVAVEHPLETAQPGWVEHDAETTWWKDFLEITRSLFHGSGVSASQVAAVGFSAISPAILPMDEAGRPLRKAILYGIDTRATKEVAELQQVIESEPALCRSGVRLSSQSAAPKILWIRHHEPDVWVRTHQIVNGSGFLLHRLTGQSTLDVYSAVSFAPFVDYENCTWLATVEKYVAPIRALPRLTWACEVAGRVTAEGARLGGLAEGTPIITGTADAAAEAISAGLAQVGDLMVMYGSSIFFILRTPQFLTAPSFWGAHFLEKGTFVLTGGMSTSGSLTRWFRNQFAPLEVQAEKAGGDNAYSVLAGLAANSPPGAKGLVVLPYFAGERTPILDPEAKGVIFGLRLEHTRGDLYRALLESIGFGIRHNIEEMTKQGGVVRRVLAVGGGTLNPLWMQIVSDIAGIEQYVPQQSMGASYGDAFLAGIGAGLFTGTREIGKWVETKQVIKPDAAAHGRYEDAYHLYRDLYTSAAPLMRRLSGSSS